MSKFDLIKNILDNHKDHTEIYYTHNSSEYNQRYINTRKASIFSQILSKIDMKEEILEIGALTGMTTRVLSAYAPVGSTVHVLDPWNGDQQGDDATYRIFLDNTKNCSNIQVHKVSSQSEEANKVYEKTFCFAYVDGNHEYNFAKSDFYNCMTCVDNGGIIVVDDCDMSAVNTAVVDTIKEYGEVFKIREIPSNFMEKYFIVER